MRRLDGFSAFMVYNDIPCCYQHTLKIGIFEWDNPEDYNEEILIEQFRKGTTIFPTLKWKLQPTPLGLNHPVWIQDTDFNVYHHVKRIACPGRGDKKSFCKLVSQLYSQPLDKSLPLWMCWIVEGLEDNRVALVTMFHHAYTDGAGAAILMQGLFDSGNCKAFESIELGVNPDETPGRFRVFLRGLIDLPIMFCKTFPRLLWSLLTHYRLRKKYIASGKSLPPSAKDAPDSPLNTTYTHGRVFSYLDFPLSDFREISHFFGVTLNDMLVAVVAGGVRRYYQSKGFPLNHSLVAGIPINMRTEEQRKAVLGNYVASSFMTLPIDHEDPIERLKIVSESGDTMKAYVNATGTPWLFLAMELVAPIVVDFINWLLRRSKGQLKLFGNIVISNVRGPTKMMRLGSGKVVNWLSIGQLFAGLGVNITAWSYADKFSICLMAEKKVIQDGDEFLDYLKTSFEEYQQLYKQMNQNKQMNQFKIKCAEELPG